MHARVRALTHTGAVKPSAAEFISVKGHKMLLQAQHVRPLLSLR